MTDGTTKYGFNWGPVAVERLTEYGGRRALRISGADKHAVEIVASPKGNHFTVYLRDGKGEWVKLVPDGGES